MVFSSCSSVDRPNSDICVVNSPGKKKSCFNMLKDYDKDGHLLPEAQPKVVPLSTLDDLNKNTCLDPDSAANLKAYIQELREVINAASTQ